MARPTSPIVADEKGDETHPSFGIVVVAKHQSTGTNLFQSDLMHRQYMTVTVHEATRKRDLAHDWTHPGPVICEFAMSLAQWGAFVSSAGDGGGTPVTLMNREGRPVPQAPYQPRFAQSMDEVAGAIDKLLTDVYDAFDKLDETESNKAPMKERRAARERLRRAIGNARANAVHTQEAMAAQAEQTVHQAKADIEAAIAQAVTRHKSLGSADMPELGAVLAQQPAIQAD